MSQSESDGSLPSPGYVPIVRRPELQQEEREVAAQAVPESVFDIDIDNMESDYDLYPQQSSTEKEASKNPGSSSSFEALQFSPVHSGQAFLRKRIREEDFERDPLDDTLPFDTSVIGISRLPDYRTSVPRLSSSHLASPSLPQTSSLHGQATSHSSRGRASGPPVSSNQGQVPSSARYLNYYLKYILDVSL